MINVSVVNNQIGHNFMECIGVTNILKHSLVISQNFNGTIMIFSVSLFVTVREWLKNFREGQRRARRLVKAIQSISDDMGRERVVSPNQWEALFLWQMVYSDLFQQAAWNPFPRPEHVYLQAHFYFLCEGTLWENSLYLRNHCAIDNST